MDKKNDSIPCPICASPKTSFLTDYLSIWSSKPFDLYKCNSCYTIFHPDPELLDYEQHSLWATKFYIEYLAGLIFMAALIKNLQILKGDVDKNLKFLDVGCGIGYTVDMAKHIGWEALGIEPSPDAEDAKELLGIDVIRNYLEETGLDTGLDTESFDIILSSEVIEHTPDPATFVQTLQKYLKNDGILLLTTPNAKAYDTESESERVGICGAGAHVFILSPESLEQLLKKSGFKDVRIFLSEGQTGTARLICFAAKAENAIPKDFVFLPPTDRAVGNFLADYLKSLLERRESVGTSIYLGALHGLIEIYTNQGRYQEAYRYCAEMDKFVAVDDIRAKLNEMSNYSLEEYIENLPCFTSRYLYHKGMVLLNFLRDYQQSEKDFELSSKLLEVEKGFDCYYANNALLPRAKYHAGISRLYDQRQRESLDSFNEILSDAGDCPEDLFCPLYYNKGIAHLQLGENISALQSFVSAIEHSNEKNFINLVGKHVIMALEQEGYEEIEIPNGGKPTWRTRLTGRFMNIFRRPR